MNASYKHRLISAADAFLDDALEEEEQASYLAKVERTQGSEFRSDPEQLLFAAENSCPFGRAWPALACGNRLDGRFSWQAIPYPSSVREWDRLERCGWEKT